MYTNSSAVDASLYSTKYVYLVKVSLMIRILSNSTPVRGSLDFGSLTIKSSATVDYASPVISGV